jgi:hypothetical protein
MLTDGQRRDLLSVSIHESGHGWIAFDRGVPRSAIILYAYCNDAGISGKYRLKVPVTDPVARTQIGLAGKIAQVLHHRPDIIDGDRLFDMLASGRIPMTESDLRMAGTFGQDDVRQTVALVRRLWPRIERTAALLVRHTTDRLAATAC